MGDEITIRGIVYIVVNAYFFRIRSTRFAADNHLPTPHDLLENHKVHCLPDSANAYKSSHTNGEFPKQQKNRI